MTVKKTLNPNPTSTARVRSLPGSYLVALFVASFLSALIAYLGYSSYALTLATAVWIIIPFLWLTDAIVFDGRRIARTGLLPRLLARATGVRDRLKISDIEQVETAVFPGIKRGRNIYYTYRTTISGKTARFVFSSGHRGYLNVIKAMLPVLDADILDNASIDLRDYLVEKHVLRKRARESDIPSNDVLDSASLDIHLRRQIKSRAADAGDAAEKVKHLRRLANELRISGRLLQALEAFRRAAVLRPRDARLLFDFAACLRMLAGSESDEKLEHKALAMMRLAERHAGNDHDLLARLGESYFQIGEWRRASIAFKKAVEVFGQSFRTLRGMAELSLREGKIAHVIHNFSAANQLAETDALRRWTKTEVDYFSHLHSDEEYMELEISRINLLDTLDKTKRSSVKVVGVGFVVIAVGILFDDSVIANVGWAVSGVSLMVWIVMILMGKMLSPRIPFDLMESDE